MTTTLKATAAVLLAAALSALLFLSPVGISSAQEDATETPDGTETPDTTPAPNDDDDGGPGRFDDLPDEEREALQAARETERQEILDAFAAELGVTAEDVTAAMRVVLEDRLAGRVADGDLTQEQADEILARTEELDGLGFGFGGPGFGGPGFGGRGFGPGHGRGLHGIGDDGGTTDAAVSANSLEA